MKAPKLIAMCQRCITEFQAVQHKTPINLFCDDFLHGQLVPPGLPAWAPAAGQGDDAGNAGEFVRQVLYGTNRYQKLCQARLPAAGPGELQRRGCSRACTQSTG